MFSYAEDTDSILKAFQTTVTKLEKRIQHLSTSITSDRTTIDSLQLDISNKEAEIKKATNAVGSLSKILG